MRSNIIYLHGSKLFDGLLEMLDDIGWAQSFTTVSAVLAIFACLQSFVLEASPWYWRLQLLLVAVPGAVALAYIRRAAGKLVETIDQLRMEDDSAPRKDSSSTGH